MGGVNGVMQMKARHSAIPDFAGLLADLLWAILSSTKRH